MSEPASARVEPEATPRIRPARSPARFLAWISSTLAIVGLLHLYIGLHLFSPAVAPAWLSGLGLTVVFALFLSIPATFFLRRRSLTGPARWLMPLAYSWIGAFWLLLSLTFATDLVRWAWLLLSRPAGERALQDAARLQAAAISGLGLILILWAHRTARGRATVERVRVPIPGLGKGLEGLRIVQISDIHIGEMLRRDFLARTVEQVNALAPDVVAITGDLVDGSVRELAVEVAPLSELKARLGVFYVTGNHEYYWDGPAWEAQVRKLGVTVLHNEHRVLTVGGDRLALGGVTDVHGGDFAPGHESRPDLAFSEAPSGLPRVLLAHQPVSARSAADAGVALQLSGHTHGGQIFPFSLLVRFQQPVVQGLKKVYGIWVYAHRGTGFWGPPMRLGPTPEIAEIELISG